MILYYKWLTYASLLYSKPFKKNKKDFQFLMLGHGVGLLKERKITKDLLKIL